MRKRKRGSEFGSYVDEDTGEVSFVQTTKQAKRSHQKSGKWYKEPTEQELRAWDREEKRQAAAERTARFEERKKFNVAKRAEKEAKEQESKRHLFELGKISFTQSLAKKDEDQQNLHSWFGGRRSKPPQPISASISVLNKNKDNAIENANKEPDCAVCKPIELEPIKKVSQQTSENPSHMDEFDTHSELHATFPVEIEPVMDLTMKPDGFDLNGKEQMEGKQEFDIAEDHEADENIFDATQDHFSENIDATVEVSANHILTNRQPLSPLSQSDLNIRATQYLQLGSFEEKLERSNKIIMSTQAIRNVLSGLCTQDLIDDLDEDLCNKENLELDISVRRKPESSDDSFRQQPPSKVVEPARSISEHVNTSFISAIDSADYDDIFAELDRKCIEMDDFDDCGLDDATLLSLPATQLITPSTHAASETRSDRPIPGSLLDKAVPVRASEETLRNIDSFAVEGLSDDDLEEALQEFERSCKKAVISSSSSTM